MSKIKLLTAALFALSQSAFAQSPPSAGGQIQQIPAAPVPQKAVPEIRIEHRAAPLPNQTHLSDSLANRLLRGLNSGDTSAIAPLENRLLLLSDIPGVNV